MKERNEFFILRTKVWKQVYVFDWKYLEEKFNFHNFNSVYLRLYFLTFGLHLNLEWNVKYNTRGILLPRKHTSQRFL